jgi:hypothetical protein
MLVFVHILFVALASLASPAPTPAPTPASPTQVVDTVPAGAYLYATVTPTPTTVPTTTTTTTTQAPEYCIVEFPPSTQVNPVTGNTGTYNVAYEGYCSIARSYASDIGGTVTVVP